MNRFRTVKGSIEEIRAVDPKTELTIYAIRKMVKENKIPYIKSGKKVLINVDNLIAYINGGMKNGNGN